MTQKTDTNFHVLINSLKLFESFEQENTDFSSICKFVRKSFGVTQKEMATALKISDRAYQYWEEGKRVPKGLPAFKLSHLYEVILKKSGEQKISQEISEPSQEQAA